MAALEAPTFSWSNRLKGNYNIIKSELSGFCLQIEPTSIGSLRLVNLGEIEANNLNQLWRFNADHTIESAVEGMFLDISGSGGKGSSICVAERSTERITQLWTLTPKGELLNDCNTYVTIKGGKKTKCATIWANTRKNSPAQRWKCVDDVNLDQVMIDSLRTKLNQAMALAAVKTAVTNDSLHCLFDQFDLDGSGALEMGEIEILIRKVMGVSEEELSDLNLKAFVGLVDLDHDGSVDFNEFTAFLGFKPHEKKSESEEESGSEEDDEEEDDEEEEEEDDGNISSGSGVAFAQGTKKR